MPSSCSPESRLLEARKECAPPPSSSPARESFAVRFPNAGRPHRCGIVLAAGDGMRLQPYVRSLRGRSLPKQYVNFVGKRSMLEHTFARVERTLPALRIFTVVGRGHLRHAEARRQLISRPRGRVVFQPVNRDTLPGLLLPLLHLRRYYPDSLVAVFPSDHYVLEEDRFMRHVDLAMDAVEQRPERLVLLGVEPSEAETEYGYILPEEDVKDAGAGTVASVRRFVEKPDAARAASLISDGALWNTMVLVFHTAALLAAVERTLPDVLSWFMPIDAALGTPDEQSATQEAYSRIVPLNLCRDLLESLGPATGCNLSVLPVRGVTWSDWGSEHRLPAAIAHPADAWHEGERHEQEWKQGKQQAESRKEVFPRATAAG